VGLLALGSYLWRPSAIIGADLRDEDVGPSDAAPSAADAVRFGGRWTLLHLEVRRSDAEGLAGEEPPWLL
jgi:hypothetical protein